MKIHTLCNTKNNISRFISTFRVMGMSKFLFKNSTRIYIPVSIPCLTVSSTPLPFTYPSPPNRYHLLTYHIIPIFILAPSLSPIKMRSPPGQESCLSYSLIDPKIWNNAHHKTVIQYFKSVSGKKKQNMLILLLKQRTAFMKGNGCCHF